MCGKVALVSSVLNKLSIYYRFFYKDHIHVWKEICRIQQSILWGDSKLKRRIQWVSWKKIYRPKESERLGVMDVELFNKILICKWKWKVLVEDEALWTRLLKHIYGKVGVRMFTRADNLI